MLFTMISVIEAIIILYFKISSSSSNCLSRPVWGTGKYELGISSHTMWFRGIRQICCVSVCVQLINQSSPMKTNNDSVIQMLLSNLNDNFWLTISEPRKSRWLVGTVPSNNGILMENRDKFPTSIRTLFQESCCLLNEFQITFTHISWEMWSYTQEPFRFCNFSILQGALTNVSGNLLAPMTDDGAARVYGVCLWSPRVCHSAKF